MFHRGMPARKFASYEVDAYASETVVEETK